MFPVLPLFVSSHCWRLTGRRRHSLRKESSSFVHTLFTGQQECEADATYTSSSGGFPFRPLLSFIHRASIQSCCSRGGSESNPEQADSLGGHAAPPRPNPRRRIPEAREWDLKRGVGFRGAPDELGAPYASSRRFMTPSTAFEQGFFM